MAMDDVASVHPMPFYHITKIQESLNQKLHNRAWSNVQLERQMAIDDVASVHTTTVPTRVGAVILP